jgi:D-alanyl-D-alanine carboxypeptidase
VPGFHAKVQPIPPAVRAQMTGVSWRPGCPVPLGDLRLIALTYRGFDGRAHTGQLVADRDAASALVGVFRRLYAARFPIRRMQLVDAYGGDDFRSIEADNTSAFNCRAATGSTHWSQHAYGRAVDVNPIENPYVSGGTSSHPASRTYLDRSRHRPGMAYEGGVLVESFRAAGWGWGGTWSGIKDYQHFSATGR